MSKIEKVTVFPSKYVESEELINCLPRHIPYNSIFVIADKFAFNEYGKAISMPFVAEGRKCVVEQFEGECSLDNINTFIDMAKEMDCVLGVGGGKALDIAKAAAHYLGLPCFVMPTSTASNAPSSRIAVIYSNEGVLLEYLNLKASPEAILIDSSIIASAPKRLMAAGIADALSSCYESLHNFSLRGSSGVVKALAQECIHALYGFGEQAMLDLELKKPSYAIKNIVESIILFSGICFENGGLYLAHATSNALTKFKVKALHGESVAYGLMVQLRYENSQDYLAAQDFFKRLNLPIALCDLGLNLTLEDKKQLVTEVTKSEKINKAKLLTSL